MTDFFPMDAFLRCYSSNINPIPNQSLWPWVNCDELNPPPITRKAGRPKLLRREADERPLEKIRYNLTCNFYKGVGHNKHSCASNPVNINKRTRRYQVCINQLIWVFHFQCIIIKQKYIDYIANYLYYKFQAQVKHRESVSTSTIARGNVKWSSKGTRIWISCRKY